MTIKSEKRAYLVDLIGEDNVAKLENAVKESATMLDYIGIESKEKEEVESVEQTEEATKEVTQDEEPAQEEGTQKEAVEEETQDPNQLMKDLVEAVAKEISPQLSTLFEGVVKSTQDNTNAITELVTQFAKMAEDVARLKKSEDERIAETIKPKFEGSAIAAILSKAASKSAETVVEEDQTNKGPSPDGKSRSWVSEVLTPFNKQ